MRAAVVRLNVLCVATKQAKTCNDRSHCWLWKYEVFSAWRTVMLWPTLQKTAILYSIFIGSPIGNPPFPCIHCIVMPSIDQMVQPFRTTIEISLTPGSLNSVRRWEWYWTVNILNIQTMLVQKGIWSMWLDWTSAILGARSLSPSPCIQIPCSRGQQSTSPYSCCKICAVLAIVADALYSH